jgi:molecular chaperone GrpE
MAVYMMSDQPATPATTECVEQLQRERANFLNYKRRVERERTEEADRMRQDTLRQVLPAIDDLDLALSHLPAELKGNVWAEGVSLAHQRFLETLRQLGVERFGNEGERFDPSIHEAVIYHEEPTATEQHVQTVLRPGYRLGPRLLRPAQVVITGPHRNGDTETRADLNDGRQDNGQGNRN